MRSIVKEFYLELDRNENLKAEVFKSREEYHNGKLSPEQTISFLKEKLIPIAHKYGFDFSLEELIEYGKNQEESGMKPLTEDELDAVSGGVSARKLTVGLCSFAVLAGSGVMLGSNFIHRGNDTTISESYQKNDEKDKDTVKNSPKHESKKKKGSGGSDGGSDGGKSFGAEKRFSYRNKSKNRDNLRSRPFYDFDIDDSDEFGPWWEHYVENDQDNDDFGPGGGPSSHAAPSNRQNRNDGFAPGVSRGNNDDHNDDDDFGPGG